jgi:pyrroline-5-carboxylate reductase
MIRQTIGFIGGGQMARALAGGLVRGGLTSAERLLVFDPAETARAEFAAQVAGARLLADNRAVIAAADVIVLAVKPQKADAVMEEVRGGCAPGKLLVSILAGTPLARLCAGFGTQRIVRVMPNTPCLVGAGAAGYALGPGATRQDALLVGELLGAVGLALEVDESLLDAVTGLSGSGPAFVYTMIEALSDGGVRVGLPRATATQLAAQTLLGAARMVLTTGEHPGVLKDRVASPGGTTIAGLQALEERGLRAALMAAVQAATERSVELAQANK